MMTINRFERKISRFVGEGLAGMDIRTLQVNLGLRCNQQCVHCHLAASPERPECMEWETMVQVIQAAKAAGRPLVDLTGGAPELNPHFRRFVSALRAEGLPVQVRTNLTVHLTEEMAFLAEFLRDHQVALVASMPCYLSENVDSQRGAGTYQASIEGLRRLNAVGYGTAELPMYLVYNPAGPFLPPEQSALERDYRRELADRFGIRFTRLLTMTNMPIGRFLTELEHAGRDRDYINTLESAFNVATLDTLMCRHQVSVRWDGTLFDCDFNLALEVPIDHGASCRLSAFDRISLSGRRIVTGEHCFGCTAGFGSSCGGALVGAGETSLNEAATSEKTVGTERGEP